jgi:polar amino acid transport system permease protein
MNHFNLSLLLTGDYFHWLIAGLGLSLWLTAVTLVLSLPLATVIALFRLAPVSVLQWLGSAYVEAIRNVPLLAHMLFWYFGAPEILPQAWKEWLYAGNMELVGAVVALTLYTAAYMSEDIRSGTRAVPRQQYEAGRALGFGFLETMRLLILPQAMRITIPQLLSQTLNLWKNTSIATVIGTAELMYQVQRVETASFRSAEAFAFATLSYLVISLAFGGLASWYHHRHPVRTAAC